LDTLGNKLVDTKLYEKMMITDTSSKFGKTAYTFKYYDKNGTMYGTPEYYSWDLYKIYTLPSSIIPALDVPIPIDIPEAWYVISDSKGTEWSIADVDLSNIKMPYNGMELTIAGKITIKGKKGTSSTVKYGEAEDISVTAQEYQTTYSFTGTGSATVSGFPIQLPLTFTGIKHNFYAKNIGLVKSVFDTINVNITFMGQTQTVELMQGSTKILIKYTK
jgi:hypothetical protein